MAIFPPFSLLFLIEINFLSRIITGEDIKVPITLQSEHLPVPIADSPQYFNNSGSKIIHFSIANILYPFVMFRACPTNSREYTSFFSFCMMI